MKLWNLGCFALQVAGNAVFHQRAEMKLYDVKSFDVCWLDMKDSTSHIYWYVQMYMYVEPTNESIYSSGSENWMC